MHPERFGLRETPVGIMTHVDFFVGGANRIAQGKTPDREDSWVKFSGQGTNDGARAGACPDRRSVRQPTDTREQIRVLSSLECGCRKPIDIAFFG